MDVTIQARNLTPEQANLTATVTVYSSNGQVFATYTLTGKPPTTVDITVPLGGWFDVKKFTQPIVRDAPQVASVPLATSDPPPSPEVPPSNPNLNSINPSTAKRSTGMVPFSANGQRFYSGSKISFGGAFISTVFVNEGKLTGTIDTAQYAIGSYLVYVDNQTGGISGTKTFSIT